MLIKTASKCLYVIELTVGFETNLDNNASRKGEKYRSLLKELRPKLKKVNFVNLSISCLGIFGNSCDSFIDMCDELKLDYQHRNFIIKKLSAIIIRTSYYIFCMRNKTWTNPELLSFLRFFAII